MKRTDFRQNRNTQTKATAKKWDKQKLQQSQEQPLPEGVQGTPHHGAIFGLVTNMLLATKIAQAAKYHHLSVHNFDRAASLVEHAKAKTPALVMIDWDACEAEGFQVLKSFRDDDKLKKVPTVGFVSQSKGQLKEEAQRAGCDRVYPKSDFSKLLDDLMVRYAT